MMESRTGNVYIQNIYAGQIKETDDGYIFAYDKEYLNRQAPVAVSQTLPLSDKPYVSSILFPFFDGLIPEGWLLDMVERNWKISSDDRFGLMLASCRDCIGDVYILPEETI